MRNTTVNFLLFFLLLLTGCVNLQPGQALTLNTYTLSGTCNTSSSPLCKRGARGDFHTDTTLLVSPMQSSPETETARMIYVKKPYTLMYFAQNRWLAPPAEMLTPLVVQSLQNTGHYRAVAFYPFSGNVNYRLDTKLLTLQQEFFRSPSRVRLVIQARLVNAKTADILSTKRIEVVRTAAADDPYHGVLATQAAVNDALRQLARFCIKTS